MQSCHRQTNVINITPTLLHTICHDYLRALHRRSSSDLVSGAFHHQKWKWWGALLDFGLKKTTSNKGVRSGLVVLRWTIPVSARSASCFNLIFKWRLCGQEIHSTSIDSDRLDLRVCRDMVLMAKAPGIQIDTPKSGFAARRHC